MFVYTVVILATSCSIHCTLQQQLWVYFIFLEVEHKCSFIFSPESRNAMRTPAAFFHPKNGKQFISNKRENNDAWNSSVIVVPDKCVRIELKLVSAYLVILECCLNHNFSKQCRD